MKILYIMHVDWNWIPQRPHFIASNLAETTDILILYPFSRNRKNLVSNSNKELFTIPIFFIPYWKKYKLIRFLNLILGTIYSTAIKKLYNPDLIWITSPELINLIPARNNLPIFYDCMDDILEFKINEPSKKLLKKLEKQLIDQSDAVFFSSKNLMQEVIQRYKSNSKHYLIYNAFQPNKYWQISDKIQTNKNLKIGYIGTISEWIDWDLLLSTLNKISKLEIILIGPTELNPPSNKKHSRLSILPPIQHDQLSNAVATFDILIIPFKINKLIESVDPVKLYEYIYFNKPIISVKYEEINRFEPFVHFYNTQQELCELIENMITKGISKKYTNVMREDFISKNTWAARVDQIKNVIEETLH
jgi:teichuronic acid biosynthesis glycosyltransferase TuaH